MELAKRLRDITKDDAMKSYEELKDIACKKTKPFARAGIKALDYFILGHRLKAKTKHGFSFVDAMRNPKRVAYLNEKVRQIRPNPDKIFADADDLLRHQYAVFQLYYGSINQFRPTEALRVYCTLKPRVGILDFSSGWGGRCLAAMALGIPYYGFDANTNLEPAYKRLIETYDPDAAVRMKFQPSESADFSKLEYDLIFTSPPYFMIEGYEKMPRYESDQAFLDNFFKPVVNNAWAGLKKGGHMALNMPHEMYMSVRRTLPPVWKRIVLPVSNRHPTNAAQGRQLGVEKERHEFTYVWKKTGAGRTITRRVGRA
jgi:hypothetical protein